MTMNPVTVTPLDWRYLENNPYVVPGGTYATLDAILAATPASGTSIMVSTAQTVASRTVPAGVNITCTPGGIITVPNGVTLTFAATATLTAGDYQVFNCTGTGKVSGLTYGKLRWWGATGDGVTEDTTAVQAAITCVLDTIGGVGGVLEGTPRDSYLVEALTINANSSIGATFDGKMSRLLQATTNNVLTIYNSGSRLVIQNWRINGQTGAYNGYGLNLYKSEAGGLTNIVVRNCEINYFDRGVNFHQVLYTVFDTVNILYCNTAIYGYQTSGSTNNYNEFRNMRISTNTVNAIYFHTAGTILFDHCALEGTAGRLVTLIDCNTFEFRSLHIEGNGSDDATTEGFYFDNCQGISINDSHLALGGGAALTAHIRMTNNTNNVRISGGYFYCAEETPLFVDDAIPPTSYGLMIKDIYVAGRASWNFGSLSYQVNNISLASNGGSIVVPMESCVVRDERANYNYANVIDDSAPAYVNNCTAAVDTTAYGTTNTIKFTATGAEPSYRCGSGSTAIPAATYAAINSMMVKTDTAQTFTMSTPIGNAVFKLPGDGKWRQLCVLDSSVVNPGVFYMKYSVSDAATGNVWYACPQYRVFATYAEACQWVGAVGY